VLLDGPPPASRLDFAYCTARINVLATARTDDGADVAAQVNKLYVAILRIHRVRWWPLFTCQVLRNFAKSGTE